MAIGSLILLMFSGLGALNGILLSLYFFSAKPKSLSNKFLAAMLLMISIRILKSVLYYFNAEIAETILQIGLSACFMIGPLLYLYCVSKVGKIESQLIKWPLHLAGLLTLIAGVGIAYPYQSNPELWGGTLYKVINFIWLLYLVMSAYVLFPTVKKLNYKQLSLTDDNTWLISVFVGNAVIWLAYFTASYTSYIVGALSFSFIFLLAFLVFIKAREGQKKGHIKYANKKIIDTEADSLILKLARIMEEEELYKNANVTMPQIAKTLGISSPYLSQLLNDNFNKSFSLFMNEYRIDAAKLLLIDEKQMSMDLIAEQCGFNSQSTFYNAFKKIVGATPAVFRKENKPILSPEL
jgi:AraC-like DNA-binding protein